MKSKDHTHARGGTIVSTKHLARIACDRVPFSDVLGPHGAKDWSC